MSGLLHQKTTLANGLRIVTDTMPQTHSVSVCVFLGVGSRYESDAEAGISHFIEHLLFKGTPRRPTSRAISEAIEGVGGLFNGGTDKEISLYWCKVSADHFGLALDVLADMLLHSRFDPQEIEKERQVIIEEIRMSRDSPAQRVDLLIDELLWPDHPLGRDIAGSKETVSQMTRDSILDYMHRQYLPHHTVVAAAGNLEHSAAVAAIDQALGDWHDRRDHARYVPYRERPAKRVRIETKDTEQAHLSLALPGLSLQHPQRFALDLLNVVLGEGMGSRLFCEIRDRLGLAYSIGSYVDHFLDTGAITVSAGVGPANLSTAIKAILEQLALLRETVPATELSKAKEMSKGRLLLRMEDSRSVAGWMGTQEVLTGNILSVDQAVAIIDAITADELKAVAEELMIGDRLRLAVVGPISQDEPLAGLLRL
ncbi:MAG: pitrilysin family protein [Dehalococcoidales bacterium]|nr:pitrilysin family protein [Dehalococcoidales bacterium]